MWFVFLFLLLFIFFRFIEMFFAYACALLMIASCNWSINSIHNSNLTWNKEFICILEMLCLCMLVHGCGTAFFWIIFRCNILYLVRTELMQLGYFDHRVAINSLLWLLWRLFRAFTRLSTLRAILLPEAKVFFDTKSLRVSFLFDGHTAISTLFPTIFLFVWLVIHCFINTILLCKLLLLVCIQLLPRICLSPKWCH